MSLTVQVTGTGVTVSPTATTSVSVASTGIVGPEGAQGTQGVQGTVGAGTQGAQGNNGTQGIQGTAGIGTQGVQGISGTVASNGAQGIQGIQGTVGVEGPKSGATSGSFGSGSYTDQLGFTSIGEVFQWTETSGSTGRPYYVNNQHVGGGTSGTIIYNNGYSTLFSGLPRSYWTFNGIPSQITLAAIDRNGVNRSSELQAATVMTIATDANNFIKYNVTYATSFGSVFTNGTYTVLQFNIVGVVSQAGTPPALATYETDPGEVMVYLGTETIGGGGGPSTWELISYLTGSQGTQGIQGTAGTGIQGTQGTTGTGTQGVQGLSGIEGPKSGITSGSFGTGSYTDQLGFTSTGEVYQWTEVTGSTRTYYSNNPAEYVNGWSSIFGNVPRHIDRSWTSGSNPPQVLVARYDYSGTDRDTELQSASILTFAVDSSNYVKYSVSYSYTANYTFSNGTYSILIFTVLGVLDQAGLSPENNSYATDPGFMNLYIGSETIGASSNEWNLLYYITGSQGAQGIQGAPGIAETGSFATTGSNTFVGNQIITGSFKIEGAGGDEGGEIQLGLAQTNTTLSGSIVFDVYTDKLRLFEGGGNSRGAFLNVSNQSNNVSSEIVTSTTVSKIETISSASYAAITPVSGTLYIIT